MQDYSLVSKERDGWYTDGAERGEQAGYQWVASEPLQTDLRGRFPYGRFFDVALIVTIVLSVAVVMLDSVQSIKNIHHETLYLAELVFTALFTIEYFLRMICVKSKKRYATSFLVSLTFLQ